MEESRYLLPRSILYIDHGKYAVIDSEEAISYILDNNLKIIDESFSSGMELIPQSIKELSDQQSREGWLFATTAEFKKYNEYIYLVGDKEKIIMFKMMFA